MRLICKLLLIFISSGTISFAREAIPGRVAIKANEIYYDSNNDSIIASGDIVVRMGNYTLNADKIRYEFKEDVIFAEENVRVVEDSGRIIYGKRAIFKDKLKRGIIEEFIAKFDESSILASKLANKLNNNRVTLEKSAFTPCKISCNNKPIWQLNAGYTNVDYEKEKITYKHVFFEVYGIPLLYLPYFFHPTPTAPAQSGLLAPEIKQDDLILPFYFRAKPNLDFTLNPRVSKNYTIFEGEMRHKVKLGQYEIRGSYGNPSFQKKDQDNITKNSRPGHYHVLAKGDFSENYINYGFDINRASDKAYLINYCEVYNSYLISKIYTNTVNETDYFSLEGFHFQDLRAKDPRLKTPLVLPNIHTQNIYSLNDSDSAFLALRNNTIAYSEPNRQLARTSLDVELMSNLISNGGHMMNFTFANRGDLYWVNFTNPTTRERERTWYRNIPEFSTRWRYPLVKSIGSKSSITIEPTAMVVIGRKYEPRFSKFGLVDSPKNDLSKNNIFSANRFSGIDFHDYGNRLSYGINSSLMSEYLYIDAFLGQLVHKNNVMKEGNSDYVADISLDVANNLELFYRFRRDQKLRPIRNEIGISAVTDSFMTNAIFTELHNVSRYFAKEGFEPDADKASQISFDVSYKLMKNLLIGMASKIDLASKATKVLVRSIRVTYFFDCVSINGAITDNFLHNDLLGVKKTKSKTISVGLKAINM